MNKDELKHRLLIALSKRGIRPAELCRELDIPKSALSQYLSGKSKNMSAERLQDIATYLNVAEAWLMGYDVPMERQTIDFESLPANLEVFKSEPRTIPVLGSIACGKPILADEEREYITVEHAPKQTDYILTARGDSMIGARIHDGDYVFIHKQPTVDDGDIAAVVIDDEATLKRVYFDRKRMVLTLVAENPAYAPLVYSGDQLNDVVIIGRAIAFQSVVR